MTDIATIGADFFKPHEGATIALADQAGKVVLTASLRQIRDEAGATLPDSPRRAFTLTLLAPAPCGVESGNYSLAHPDFGVIGPVHVIRTVPGELSGAHAWFRVYFN